jgi:hypothetical protein
MTAKTKKPRRSRAKGTGRTISTPKRGKPAHEPTDETRHAVAAMASFGSPQVIIARIVGVSMDTLRRHYDVELDAGKSIVDAKVGGTLVRKAIAGDAAFTIFYAKTRMGLREKDEEPTPMEVVIRRAVGAVAASEPSVTPPPEPGVTGPHATGGDPSGGDGAA